MIYAISLFYVCIYQFTTHATTIFAQPTPAVCLMDTRTNASVMKDTLLKAENA